MYIQNSSLVQFPSRCAQVDTYISLLKRGIKETKMEMGRFLLLLHGVICDILFHRKPCGINHSKGEALGFMTICLRGWATSVPPACLTNSAGEWKLPWQTHIILTSSPLLYLYSIPSTLLPLGPSPLVKTHGMFSNVFVPVSFSFARLFAASSFLDGLSISPADILLPVSLIFDPDEPISWLPPPCNEWILAGLSSPDPAAGVHHGSKIMVETINRRMIKSRPYTTSFHSFHYTVHSKNMLRSYHQLQKWWLNHITTWKIITLLDD